MLSLVKYAYGNARMRAFASHLLDDRVFERLAVVRDPAGFGDALRGTRYEGMPLPSFSRKDVERAEEWMRAKEEEEIDAVIAGYPTAREREVLGYVRQAASVEALKAAVRVWRERQELGRPPALPLQGEFADVYGASDREHLLGLLAQRGFNVAGGENEGPVPWFVVEARLDFEFLRRWRERVERLSPSDRKAVLRIAGIEIDRMNMRVMSRAMRYYSGEKVLLSLILPFGCVFTEDLVVRLRESDAPVEVLSRVTGPYGNLADLVRMPAEEMERVFDAALVKEVRRALAGNPFSLGGAVGFVILRRRETGRLGMLLREKMLAAEAVSAGSEQVC